MEPCFPGYDRQLSNLSIDLNPKVHLDVSDSYFDRSALMSGVLIPADERDDRNDPERDLDSKINEKMSEGLKKVASLVIAKFDSVLEQKIKLMMSLEVADLELRLDRKYL